MTLPAITDPATLALPDGRLLHLRVERCLRDEGRLVDVWAITKSLCPEGAAKSVGAPGFGTVGSTARLTWGLRNYVCMVMDVAIDAVGGFRLMLCMQEEVVSSQLVAARSKQA